MPQYTIKLNTYDPAIIDAFELLRKCRKQAGFTHEALKYFLLSEKGAQVIDLMSREQTQQLRTSPKVDIVELPRDITTTAKPAYSSHSISSRDHCSDVLEKILK